MFQPPPFPELGCTPRGHRRLLVLLHDLWALAPTLLVQHETGFDVSTLLLPCVWKETGTLPRALPSTQSFQSNFSRRLCLSSTRRTGAGEKWQEPRRHLTNSDLPHRCREGCNFSFAERQKSSREVFSQELSRLSGPNFFGINLLLILHDAVFWDVRGKFPALPSTSGSTGRQRTVSSFLQKHQLRVEQQSALFWQVSRPCSIVRMSSPRLLWRVPAKETMASRCSCTTTACR